MYERYGVACRALARGGGLARDSKKRHALRAGKGAHGRGERMLLLLLLLLLVVVVMIFADFFVGDSSGRTLPCTRFWMVHPFLLPSR